MDFKTLMQQSNNLFESRGSLLSFWQTIAENFYPERADFTFPRGIGEEFATNLMTSYPILARRDLGNALGSMLRPTSKKWAHIQTNNYDTLGVEARAWLEEAENRMRRAMHDKNSQFSRATKEGDHDFSAFGQCALQITLNKDADGLLYRCWHLRDMAWAENANGVIDVVHRKWAAQVIDLVTLFGKKVHPNVRSAFDRKEFFTKVNVRHCIVPAAMYDGLKKYSTPFISIYFDADNEHIIEEVGVMSQEYIIPRWSTIPGSQYACSPATIIALPDARLLQAMTLVLLEAGEKAVNPPLIAVEQALRSEISVFAGGITWADADHDPKLGGDVVRPLMPPNTKSGLPLGIDMANRLQLMLAEAFFLNKLTLPQPGTEMTAYEVGQRVQEYIRHAMPLFEPMEYEYNSPLCVRTFEVMLRAGAFGSPLEIPDELQGEEVIFKFESPLHDAVEREKGQRFLEAKAMLADAAAIDPSVVDIIDASETLRDVLKGIGVPAKWTRSEEAARKITAAREQRQEASDILSRMQQGADVAKTLGEAGARAPQPAAPRVV